MNRNALGNLLVFDIEGTDSKERGEQRMVSAICIGSQTDLLLPVDFRANDVTFRACHG